ncbi:hypothetical protein PENTCL1PPCAC_16589 [Pristionchus entomophagus]|uniref:C-type lectin domain-containing protein n=1 Tax=Pristionchus entomophagus TaxID=358040 RepID=A0AAV5TJD6_9BILA|nr:hypothetical protein PENTCL1PPCAC_16589 [Pristionchus entomophagus]
MNHCMCPSHGPPPNFGFHVDMAFLVEVTKSGVDQIKELVQYLPELIRDNSSQHHQWIDRLVLIGYNSHDVLGMVDAPMGNPTKLLQALQAWADSNPTDDGCVVRVWEAMNHLLRNRQVSLKFRQMDEFFVFQDGPKHRPLPRRSIINIFESSITDNQRDAIQVFSAWVEICNPFVQAISTSESDFRIIEQAARRGDGKMYTLDNSDIKNIIHMIPTLFSSSIVYKYHSEDCTAKQSVVYFPVDAFTQTVSAIVAGYKSEVQLYRYNGDLFNIDGRIPIYQNEMEKIVEFRNHSTAGQKIWLGLHYENGWVFQQDRDTSIPVPGNINYWDGGNIPDGSGGKTCAYFDPKGTKGYWFASECTAKYSTVCQKHMYDANHEPSSIVDDDLSPGKYYLVINSDDDHPTGWRGCDVEVRVQSDLNVEFGFVDGLRKDNPHPVVNIGSNSNRVVSSISIGTGKTDLSVLQHVLMRADSNQNLLLEAATYSYRFGCSYEYYSQPLNCELTNGKDFDEVHIREDDTGNTFQ